MMRAVKIFFLLISTGFIVSGCENRNNEPELIPSDAAHEYYLVHYFTAHQSLNTQVESIPLKSQKLSASSRPGPRPEKKTRLVLGSERLLEAEYFSLIAGKNIAIMANQSAKPTVDRLIADPRTHLVAIFAPEHGFNGQEKAGTEVADNTYKGVPVYGRYGGGDDSRRIPAELLQGVDALLFEIQDLGTRHYTFISSMYLAMDSAADAGIPFIVLDRPVALNGVQIEGPLLASEYQTFIGVGRLPNRYAMTIGELTLLFKNEPGLMHGPRFPRAFSQDAYYNIKDLNLIVVPMKNYNRSLYYDEIYGKGKWTKPSPNIPNLESALCYVGTGLLSGHPIQELVKGYNQFNYIAFPFIKDHHEMKNFLKQAEQHYSFPGVKFKILIDKNTGIPNVLFFQITDRKIFNPTLTALALMYTQALLYPDLPFITSSEAGKMFINAFGDSWFLNSMLDKEHLSSFSEIAAQTERGLSEFKAIRQKYLLY
jgi:uncharacterized protein YbbC (DUF1343 family)